MLKKLSFSKNVYFEPEELISEVITPCFSVSKQIDLLSAYFNFDSFIEIADSLEKFLTNEGRFRILISIPRQFEKLDFSKIDTSILEAYSSRSNKESYEEFMIAIKTKTGLLKDELQKNKVGLIAYLVKNNIVDIKFSIRNEGYDHSKYFIFKEGDDCIVLSSTMNWTLNGLTLQSNETNIHCSFDDSKDWQEYVSRFNKIWNDELENIESFRFDSEFADDLLEKIGNPEYEDIKNYFKNKTTSDLYFDIKTSPLYFEFNLGNSALLPHQVVALNKGLDSWPIRHLFADEVGLGKTLEVGSAIAYLNLFKNMERIVILAPQSVVNQWQLELKHHFGLDFYTLSKDKKHWIDLNQVQFEKEDNEMTYDIAFPKKIILSKDLARGSKGNNIFSGSSKFPDVLVIDEAHHARASKKTNSFKQTLLRELVLDCNENVPHILFATATPMRTHPDEYYFLLELLGIDKFLSENQYMSFLQTLTVDVDEWKLNEIVNIFSILKPLADASSSFNETIFTINEIKLLEEIKKTTSENQDLLIKLLNSSEDLQNIVIKYNPLSSFTSKSSRSVLSLYPTTYKFPERVFESSPITSKNIYKEFSIFFKDLMSYADDEYLSSEQAMGVSMNSKAFAKAGFKESFVSSFWSARERLINRKKRVENYIERIEKNETSSLLIEKNLLDELNDDTEFDSLEIFTIKKKNKINKNNLLNICKQERSQIDSLIQYSDYLKEKHKEPDPKIEHLKIILDKILDEDKPTLVFAHYIATLDNAYSSVIKEFASRLRGVGMYKGNEIWYEINGKRYQSDKYNIKKLLETGEIQILFCSEAASEGINLQAADKMINIDVPWVPSVLEQRIGRIARLGQESDEVKIYNLWYPDSYEADIYQALIDRVDLLKIAMGSFPSIVSKKIKTAVSDSTDVVVSLIDELNQKKAEVEYKGLAKLWDYDKQNHDTFGNNFREELLNLISNHGFDISDYTYKAGDDNVFTFKTQLFKDFIESFIISDSGETTLYKIVSDNKFYGFAVKDEKEDAVYLLSPRDLPKILETLLTQKKNTIEILGTMNLMNRNLNSIILSYKNKLSDWFLPDHLNLNKDSDNQYKEIMDYQLEKIANIEIELVSDLTN